MVEAPKEAGTAPKIEDRFDGTTVTLSAGGQLATGNSRLTAGTANGSFETRWKSNEVGASVLGNYGRSAPPGQPLETTAENIQARLRYDRYIIEQASFFLINTGRHDRFQGIDFRYNLDPGFKYLFLQEAASSIWAELGYDFQYDVRREDARPTLDAAGNPVVDAAGNPVLLDKTASDHSLRLFVGAKHAFNEAVTFATGVEYLQSFVESTRSRVNYDAVLAANVGGGLAIGVGFTARYDHAPLPGKETLDTATTLSLIYAFSNVGEPAKPETCPCPKPAPAEEAPPPARTTPATPPSEPAPAAQPEPAATPEPSQPAEPSGGSTPPSPSENAPAGGQ